MARWHGPFLAEHSLPKPGEYVTSQLMPPHVVGTHSQVWFPIVPVTIHLQTSQAPPPPPPPPGGAPTESEARSGNESTATTARYVAVRFIAEIYLSGVGRASRLTVRCA